MSKYITVENFTKKDARRFIEMFEFILDMNRSNGSPEEENLELEEKISMLKEYWNLRWNEEFRGREEYGMYKVLGPLVE